MKTLKLFLFIGILLGAAACVKENPKTSQESQEGKDSIAKTITLGSVIDWTSGADESKATFSASDLSVGWQSTDRIAVANNVNDVIEEVSISVDALDPTRGTIVITDVGATTYYAYYPYSGGLTFDHTTATFSGPSIGNTAYSIGSVSDSNTLAMAGKVTISEGTTITFSPCLALVEVTMANNSIAPSGSYKAVDGFDFYEHHQSSGAPRATGSYSVSFNTGSMVVSATGADDWGNTIKQVRPAANTPLTSGKYYFAIIPAGDVTGLYFAFYAVDGGWGNIYELSNTKNFSIAPGDYLAVGPLDPVAKKQAIDSYSPAITVDGDMSDWSEITCSAAGSTGTGNDAVQLIKAVADAKNVYVYLKVDNSKLYNADYTYSNRSYLYIGDGTAGSVAGYWTGGYYKVQVEGWLKNGATPSFTNWSGGVIVGGAGSGYIDEGILYLEMAIARSKVDFLKNKAASNAYIGFTATDAYYIQTPETWGGTSSLIGCAPAQDTPMLEVSVPAFNKYL